MAYVIIIAVIVLIVFLATRGSKKSASSSGEADGEKKPIVTDYEIRCSQGDFGKCSYYKEEFCFTCPQSQPCPKKKEHINEICEPRHPRLINYANELDWVVKRRKELSENGSDFLLDVYFRKERDIYIQFAKEFYPNLVETVSVAGIPLMCGIGKTEIGVLVDVVLTEANKIKFTENDGNRLAALVWICLERPSVIPAISAVFFSEQLSFPRVDEEDFWYLVKQTIIFFEDEERNAKIFKDTSAISWAILLGEENGRKRIGYGGELAGEVGDTLWNTVESIVKDNIKDEEMYNALVAECDALIAKHRS